MFKLKKIFFIKILNYLGLYKTLKWIYNKIFRYNKKTIMSINNIKLYFWTPTFYLDYYIKEYSEKNILQYFLNKVSNTDIVWDIGANFGIYSLPLSKVVSSNGKVYAFEPEKNTFELLKKN